MFYEMTSDDLSVNGKLVNENVVYLERAGYRGASARIRASHRNVCRPDRIRAQ